MAQTPIYDELHATYTRRAGSPTQARLTRQDLRTVAVMAALAAAVMGLVFVSSRNPGMALVTMFLFTVVFWAVERILASSRGL